jgi:hypothetical protein
MAHAAAGVGDTFTIFPVELTARDALLQQQSAAHEAWIARLAKQAVS